MDALNPTDASLLGAEMISSAALGGHLGIPSPLTGEGGGEGEAVDAAEMARGLEAAHGFEAILLHRLVEAMRETVPDGGLLSSPAGRRIEGLFWFYLAEEMAKKGGVGLWKDLARKLELAGGDPPASPAQGPQA